MVLPKLLTAFVMAIPLVVSSSAGAAEEHVDWCGRVSSYLAPTASVPGRIVIGNREFAIASASTPTAEKFSPAQLMDKSVCISGRTDAQGRLVPDPVFGLGLTPMPPALCGLVTHYRSSRPGEVWISGGSGQGAKFLLDESGRWPADLIGTTCIEIALNSDGSAVARRLTDSTIAQPGQPAGLVPPEQLPNTSTAPVVLAGLLAAAGGVGLLVWRRRNH